MRELCVVHSFPLSSFLVDTSTTSFTGATHPPTTATTSALTTTAYQRRRYPFTATSIPLLSTTITTTTTHISPPSILETAVARRQINGRPQRRRLDLSSATGATTVEAPPQPHREAVGMDHTVTRPAAPRSGPRMFLTESGAAGAAAVVGFVEGMTAILNGSISNGGGGVFHPLPSIDVGAAEFCSESIGCMCGVVSRLYTWSETDALVRPVDGVRLESASRTSTRALTSKVAAVGTAVRRLDRFALDCAVGGHGCSLTERALAAFVRRFLRLTHERLYPLLPGAGNAAHAMTSPLALQHMARAVGQRLEFLADACGVTVAVGDSGAGAGTGEARRAPSLDGLHDTARTAVGLPHEDLALAAFVSCSEPLLR
jgi:hypothetical protein